MSLYFWLDHRDESFRHAQQILKINSQIKIWTFYHGLASSKENILQKINQLKQSGAECEIFEIDVIRFHECGMAHNLRPADGAESDPYSPQNVFFNFLRTYFKETLLEQIPEQRRAKINEIKTQAPEIDLFENLMYLRINTQDQESLNQALAWADVARYYNDRFDDDNFYQKVFYAKSAQ